MTLAEAAQAALEKVLYTQAIHVRDAHRGQAARGRLSIQMLQLRRRSAVAVSRCPAAFFAAGDSGDRTADRT